MDFKENEISLDTLVDNHISSYNTSGNVGMEKVIELAGKMIKDNSSLYILLNKNVIGSAFLILSYCVTFLVSLFGNFIVCVVIFRNRRMRTVTNLFIVNLALADILVTLLNVPFTIPRHLIDNWPFGDFICHIYNFSLMVSVYVSTYTMLSIAMDRHQVILYPLRPRICLRVGLGVVVIIWIVSLALSIPFGLYQTVKNVNFLSQYVQRCTGEYPKPSDVFEKGLTLTTLTLQYILPLLIIAIAYGRIVQRLWVRTSLGALTHEQQISQARTKRKSIKMLITVVIVFGICWMPLNLYHVITDFHHDKKSFKHDSTAFFICHWFAISSTCYNPFVYCWLNEAFRNEVKRLCGCCFKSVGSSMNATEYENSVVTRHQRLSSHWTSFKLSKKQTSYMTERKQTDSYI